MFKKKIKKRVINLKKGLSQEVIVCRSNNIAFVRGKKIYVNEEFFRLLNPSEQRAVIYHEKHHTTKEARFLAKSSMFIWILGLILFLPGILLLVILKFYLFFIGLSLIIAFASLRWLIETMADANAVKSVGKDLMAKTLRKVYENNHQKRGVISNFFNNYLLHVPLKLRIRIIQSLD